MNIYSISQRSFRNKHLLIVTLALFSLLCMNLDSKAQVMPPVECMVLDDFQNTELPDKRLDIFSTDPDAVNVLDDGSPGVLGGIRNITYGPLRGTPGFFASSALTIDVNPLTPFSSLTNSNDPDSMTPFSILYNADGAGLNLDFSNTVSISFVVVLNDQPNTSATIVIGDSEGNTAQSSLNNLPSLNGGDTLPADIDFLISELSGIEDVDITDIQNIEFRSNPTLGGSDVSFDALEICSIPTRDVPTLSEWGLIAMAGVLGIVSFMVMRRRKVAA